MKIDLEDKGNDGRFKILLGSIMGFILTFGFFYQYFLIEYSPAGTGAFSGPPPDPFCEPLFSAPFCGSVSPSLFFIHSTILLAYYIFNCLLLLSIFFALLFNKPKIAKFIAIILNISVFSSLFWVGIGINSVFFFTVILGSLFGLVVPLLGLIPVILFFLGITSSIFLVFKK